MPLSVDEDDLTLKAEIYSSLLHIHIDRADWKGALQLLDKAIRDMPRTRHQLWVKTNQIMRTGWRRWEGSGTVDTYSRKTKYIFCILSLFFFYQTSAEVSYTGEGTTGGKHTAGHAEITTWRRAVLFSHVAPGGTVGWQCKPTADLLPEFYHLSLGNTYVPASFSH